VHELVDPFADWSRCRKFFSVLNTDRTSRSSQLQIMQDLPESIGLVGGQRGHQVTQCLIDSAPTINRKPPDQHFPKQVERVMVDVVCHDRASYGAAFELPATVTAGFQPGRMVDLRADLHSFPVEVTEAVPVVAVAQCRFPPVASEEG
jgi:hypothetical protein